MLLTLVGVGMIVVCAVGLLVFLVKTWGLIRHYDAADHYHTDGW